MAKASKPKKAVVVSPDDTVNMVGFSLRADDKAIEQLIEQSEVTYTPTAFDNVFKAVVRENPNFRYGAETVAYINKDGYNALMPKSADDLARQIWQLLGGDKLGDGLVAQYLFKLATQQLDRVIKAIVEYARVNFGETAGTVTEATIERISVIPFDQFIEKFEEILKKMDMTTWQRFVWWVVKFFSR